MGAERASAAGLLDALVATSRRRNLGIALGLNGLILIAGLALLRHTRRSRELAEAQMNFVANVSHELRTPLTVIRAAANNLQRGVVLEPARIEQYTSLIGQHAEQLGKMVEQVLVFASAQQKTLPLSRERVSIAAILREAAAACLPETTAAQCRVEVGAADDLPEINGDPAALGRVFQNLIANAAKHGGRGGIGVTARKIEVVRNPMIENQVADRGPGIPKNEQAEIFEPFFRGAEAQAQQIRGSGLGLRLAREIVEAHGGHISVKSESGQGAIFSVRLPVADAKSLP